MARILSTCFKLNYTYFKAFSGLNAGSSLLKALAKSVMNVRYEHFRVPKSKSMNTCMMKIKILINFCSSFVVIFRIPHFLTRILTTKISLIKDKTIPHDCMTLSKRKVSIFSIDNGWDFFHWVDFYKFIRSRLW